MPAYRTFWQNAFLLHFGLMPESIEVCARHCFKRSNKLQPAKVSGIFSFFNNKPTEMLISQKQKLLAFKIVILSFNNFRSSGYQMQQR